jgi:catechol 2,3-dioxygenase-like lactoylglutathione lyase family enzyme
MLHIVEQWLARYEAGEIDRRGFLQGVAALAGGAMTAPASAARPTGLTVSGVHHVEIKTTDLNRASRFYAGLLGVRPQVRPERVVMPLGSGDAQSYLSIGVGPIPRVDHFSVKVPALHPRNPQKAADRLVSLGYKARHSDASIFVMDPDGFEVELEAPTARL